MNTKKYKFTVEYNNGFSGTFYGTFKNLKDALENCLIKADCGIKKILWKLIYN